MLLDSRRFSQPRIVIIMTDIAVIAESIETTLRDVAKQTSELAAGLQNVAPHDKAATPNQSVQYLVEITNALTDTAEKVNDLYTFARPGFHG